MIPTCPAGPPSCCAIAVGAPTASAVSTINQALSPDLISTTSAEFVHPLRDRARPVPQARGGWKVLGNIDLWNMASLFEVLRPVPEKGHAHVGPTSWRGRVPGWPAPRYQASTAAAGLALADLSPSRKAAT